MSRRYGGQSEHTKLYHSAAWKKRRLAQLKEQPLCEMCLAAGIIKAATVADHVVRHGGDLDLFYYGELQSLDTYCHNVAKQQIENFGYSAASSMDGYPTDPNSPVNVDAARRAAAIKKAGG